MEIPQESIKSVLPVEISHVTLIFEIIDYLGNKKWLFKIPMFKRLLILVIIALLLSLLLARKILTKNSPIGHGTLIVESWLPPTTLEEMVKKVDFSKYNSIIFAGTCYKIVTEDSAAKKVINFPENPIQLNHNGILEIEPVSFPKTKKNKSNTLKIICSGTSVNKVYPHVIVQFDDSIISQFFTNKSIDTVVVSNSLPFKKIKITYDNDIAFGSFDRNFTIYGIYINNKEYNSDFLTYKTLGINNNETSIEYPFASNAAFAENYIKVLTRINIPLKKVEVPKSGRNITFKIANGVKDYLENAKSDSGSFDIVSYNFHSRRSYRTYKYLLGKRGNVGIISLSNPDATDNWYMHSAGYNIAIDEMVSYLGLLLKISLSGGK